MPREISKDLQRGFRQSPFTASRRYHAVTVSLGPALAEAYQPPRLSGGRLVRTVCLLPTSTDGSSQTNTHLNEFRRVVGTSFHPMYNFPHQLVVVNDQADQDRPIIGFNFNGMTISDPFASSCGRFLIEPFEYDLNYEQAQQLRLFNDAITAATEQALERATSHVNQLLLVQGLEPKAGFFKSAVVERNAIWSSLAAYLVASLNAEYFKQTSVTKAFEPRRGQSIRIAPTGIEFVRDERAALPSIQGWWNATPLPRGQICVHNPTGGGPEVALWVQSSKIDIRVFDLGGKALFTAVVDGRDGLNKLYESFVGYRPDDDSFEPDAVKLLARVCEIAYRHATGDDS